MKRFLIIIIGIIIIAASAGVAFIPNDAFHKTIGMIALMVVGALVLVYGIHVYRK